MNKTVWELLADWHKAEGESRAERAAEPEAQYRSAYGDWPKREAALKALNELFDHIAIYQREGASAVMNREALPIEASPALAALSDDLNAIRGKASSLGFEFVGCICERDDDGPFGTFFQSHCVYGDGKKLLECLQQAIDRGSIERAS